MAGDPYASGVLNPDVHARLVADMANIAAEAGIPAHWIATPLAQTCGPAEVAWARHYRFHGPNGRSGLVLGGKHMEPDAETRMAALAGALLRNFVSARVMTLHELLARAHDGQAPEASCLLVPNFFAGRAAGAKAAAGHWRFAVLLDVLLARHAAGRQTVLHVSDMPGMGAEYGDGLRRHVEAHYEVLAP